MKINDTKIFNNDENLSRKIIPGDCLDVMKSMPAASIDLIATDPPFFTQKVRKGNNGEYEDKFESLESFLEFMRECAIEMKRLLKPGGSLYWQCDSTASHYLKVTLDKVFGMENFKNDIIWKRNSSHNDSHSFGKITDMILFYGTKKINVDEIRVPLDKEYIDKAYSYEDEAGRYMADNLTAKGLSGGGYDYDFHGHNGPWRYPEHRMLELERDGRIHMPTKRGGVPRLKRYLHENKGKVMSNLWLDIAPLQGGSKERTGYPTQKPEALYERIILASSNPGDVVFDPFMGSGTTLAAARKLGRNYLGIDVNKDAVDIARKRLEDQLDSLGF